MTYVQLLHNRNRFEKVDNLTFLTNNPEGTLQKCNRAGLWDSIAILGPMEFHDAQLAGGLLVHGTRGVTSKFQKIQQIALEYNVTLYLGMETPDTGLLLEDSLCGRERHMLNPN